MKKLASLLTINGLVPTYGINIRVRPRVRVWVRFRVGVRARIAILILFLRNVTAASAIF